MEIGNKIRELVCRLLAVKPEQVNEEVSFVDDLGADSLAIVELALALEETFDINISDAETEKIKSFKDAVDYIEAKLSLPTMPSG